MNWMPLPSTASGSTQAVTLASHFFLDLGLSQQVEHLQHVVTVYLQVGEDARARLRAGRCIRKGEDAVVVDADLLNCLDQLRAMDRDGCPYTPASRPGRPARSYQYASWRCLPLFDDWMAQAGPQSSTGVLPVVAHCLVHCQQVLYRGTRLHIVNGIEHKTTSRPKCADALAHLAPHLSGGPTPFSGYISRIFRCPRGFAAHLCQP